MPRRGWRFEAADAWYRQRNADAATEFVVEISEAIQSVREAPHRWPAHLFGTRRFMMGRFPYAVIYLDAPERVNIVAVAHSKRKPGYWKRRL